MNIGNLVIACGGANTGKTKVIESLITMIGGVEQHLDVVRYTEENFPTEEEFRDIHEIFSTKKEGEINHTVFVFDNLDDALIKELVGYKTYDGQLALAGHFGEAFIMLSTSSIDFIRPLKHTNGTFFFTEGGFGGCIRDETVEESAIPDLKAEEPVETAIPDLKTGEPAETAIPDLKTGEPAETAIPDLKAEEPVETAIPDLKAEESVETVEETIAELVDPVETIAELGIPVKITEESTSSNTETQ